MEIDLKKLRMVVNRLFDHVIDTRNTGRVTLDKVHYWDLSSQSLYDMDIKPTEFDVGSLSDDWEFLKSLLNENEQPVAIQLTEVAPLIRAIGEALGPQLASKGG